MAALNIIQNVDTSGNLLTGYLDALSAIVLSTFLTPASSPLWIADDGSPVSFEILFAMLFVLSFARAGTTSPAASAHKTST